ncbi:NAD(P)/FAD-dependent oxidoreductase [Desulfovibrio sp. OttesenSCG-928-C06]|nr:NAD(P)/FAD-dependent oxidoreductase [Desulfovibrio sp. OttesenSCG-928-C06]
MQYAKIFEPITIKRMTLRNRIVMPPIGTNFAGQDGSFTEEHIRYYTQRAKGGTGLITLENVCIDYPMGTNGTTQLRFDNDMYIPGMFKFTETMHNHGACVSVQLNHAGASAFPLRLNGQQQVSSSDQPSKTGGAVPRPLSVEEIHAIVKKFGEAASRAQRAGFDAVEIHAGHSYLISQFLSPIYNKRTDEFGGSMENRCRFARMVIDEVRKAVGPFFPICLRVSLDEFQQGGNSMEDGLKILEYLNDEIDMFNVSSALNDCLQYQIDKMSLPDGWRAYMAKAVKDKFGKPVMASGNFRDPKVVQKTLADGDADLIVMGRGLIAEPNWVNKVMEGREHLLRKCVSCNIGCADHRIGRARPIRCTVNPDVVNEDSHKQFQVKNQVVVAVVGGGSAGLEAACTAAEVGCNVHLFEASDKLGGLSRKISTLPDKKRLNDFPTYLANRAAELPNLHIHMNTTADLEKLKVLSPDVVVVATGSNPLLPPIAGLHDRLGKPGTKVLSILDFIGQIDSFDSDSAKGKKIAVVGGGAVGLDVVEHFATRGAAEVSIIEMLPLVGKDLDVITKLDVNEMLTRHKVNVLASTALKEVKDDCFVLEKDGKVFEQPFDYGFVCLGMRANNAVCGEFGSWCLDSNVKMVNIGDTVVARRIIDGVREGRAIVNTIRLIDERKSEKNRACGI